MMEALRIVVLVFAGLAALAAALVVGVLGFAVGCAIFGGVS